MYKQLVEILGDESLVDTVSVNSYKVNEIMPEVVVSPKTVKQVESVIECAGTLRETIIPWGGGTRIQTGNVQKRYSVALDMRGFNTIKEYEPADLMIIAGAGTTIEHMNSVLKANNQFVALNPPQQEKTTLGGVVASNDYGYLRGTYGTVRDMILGARFVRSNGEYVKGGGKVTKNVAGYDLTRMLIGSWGTLGIITEIALRVYPLPEISKTVTAEFASLESAFSTAMSVLNSHFSPTFALTVQGRDLCVIVSENSGVRGENHVYLVFGIDGIEEAVAWQEEKSIDTCRKNRVINCNVLSSEESMNVRKGLQDSPSSQYDGVLTKIATTRTTAQELQIYINEKAVLHDLEIELLNYTGSGISYLFLPGTGNNENASQETIAAFIGDIQSFVKSIRGSCVLEKAPVWLKNRCSVWQEFPGEKLMIKLKKELDPKNILNPERFISVE